MNKLKLVSIFLLAILSFSGCEKDDICVDSDTALLIIRFYDVEDPTKLKVVPGLRVVGMGKEEPVDTFADRSSTLDSIAIPLKPTDIITGFTFIINSEDDESGEETGKTDSLQFSYTTEEEYKSRACGFIVKYDNLTTDFTPATENWIQDIEITKPFVQIQDTVSAHVKIYH